MIVLIIDHFTAKETKLLCENMTILIRPPSFGGYLIVISRPIQEMIEGRGLYQYLHWFLHVGIRPHIRGEHKMYLSKDANRHWGPLDAKRLGTQGFNRWA